MNNFSLIQKGLVKYKNFKVEGKIIMMKKRLFRTFSALLVCVVLSGGIGTVPTYASSPTPSVGSTSSVVQPQSDVIDWVYKFIDGKLCKRLYNYTQEKWIGDWIPA